ncbi:uncharacterized protein G2W53_043431 [Senna tora]|uniref:Uncharacterized protein n=1 Tax=Senna tora TaxID=362788 RepID=A0A834W0K1_9FABA|nr:uncharacterized protein G2W53_043431 [Senna tora]
MGPTFVMREIAYVASTNTLAFLRKDVKL